MAKALRDIQSKLKQVDLVMEVRDARMPFTSANEILDASISAKRRVVVLNKWDLCDVPATRLAIAHMRAQGLAVFTASAPSQATVSAALKEALEWLTAERTHADLSLMMVLGVPNVGKSSLINALKLCANSDGLLGGEQAYHKTAKTGPLPGVTQQLGGFQVSKKPNVYVLDTPGVLLPNMRDETSALKLALLGAVRDGVVPDTALVKYMLQLLATPVHQAQLWRSLSAHKQDVTFEQRSTQQLARIVYDAINLDCSSPVWHPGSDDQTEIEGPLPKGWRRAGAIAPNGRDSYSGPSESSSSSSSHGDTGGSEHSRAAVGSSSGTDGSNSSHGSSSSSSEASENSKSRSRAGSHQSSSSSQHSLAGTRETSSSHSGGRSSSGSSSGKVTGRGTSSLYRGVADLTNEDADARLQHVLFKMGVAGSRDPGRRDAMLHRVVTAFRTGQLGKFTLDSVEEDVKARAAAVGGISGKAGAVAPAGRQRVGGGVPVPVGRQRGVGQGRSVVGEVVGGMYGRFDVGVGVGSAVRART
ncbi:MAG: hypothetical protein WDW38_010113 [Sanguina aurantia]